jgi:hypothetical protein
VWPRRRVEQRAGLEIVDTPTFRYCPFTTCKSANEKQTELRNFKKYDNVAVLQAI